MGKISGKYKMDAENIQQKRLHYTSVFVVDRRNLLQIGISEAYEKKIKKDSLQFLQVFGLVVQRLMS